MCWSENKTRRVADALQVTRIDILPQGSKKLASTGTVGCINSRAYHQMHGASMTTLSYFYEASNTKT